MSDHLQERFPVGFEFITTLNFTLDNDEFMSLYNSYKIIIRNVVLSNGNKVDDEQRTLINRHLEAGTSYREIARKIGCESPQI